MKLIFSGTALVVAALIIVGCSGLGARARQGKITVYYFPIGEETLTPVTSANIQARGQHCEIQAPKDISKIKNLLSSAARPSSQKFSDLVVRVKLIETSDTGDRVLTLIEHQGQVRFSNGTEGTLAPKSMKTIKRIIEAQCKKDWARARQGKMTAYYFPIGAETLKPVTSANIQERGSHCEIHSLKDISKIKKLLRGAAKPSSQKFSDLAVRVKLIETSDKGETLLTVIENEGAVRFSNGTEGVLSSSSMKAIKRIIEAQCKKSWAGSHTSPSAVALAQPGRAG